MGGVGILHRTGVAAEAFQVIGILATDPSGSITIGDDSGTSGIVSGMYLRPYLGQTVTVEGGTDDGILYVRELTLGALALDAPGGRILFATTGTVQEGTEGFQVSVEGSPSRSLAETSWTRSLERGPRSRANCSELPSRSPAYAPTKERSRSARLTRASSLPTGARSLSPRTASLVARQVDRSASNRGLWLTDRNLW